MDKYLSEPCHIIEMKYRFKLTWMNLENIEYYANERSQTWKDRDCVILFVWNVQIKQTIESSWEVAAGLGCGEEWAVSATG